MVSTTDEIVNEVAPVEAQQQVQAEIKSVSEEDFEKAQKLFQLGKKNLFLNKYDESVNNIGEACKTYASKFGEMDPQCAEVYFFYGRALLELARIENTVLGNALTGVPEENEPINDSRYGNPEEMTADEKNEISEKVIEALCSTEEELKNGEKTSDEPTTTAETKTTEETTTTTTTTTETTTKAEETTTTEAKATTEETTKPAETTTGDDTTTPKPETDAKDGEAENDDEDEDDEADEEETGEEETAEGAAAKEDADDISNLQSSWEMFELAKLIYTKHFDEDKLFKGKRVAECLLKLGEISIEQELYEQACTDIGESIRVQEEMASGERDERMLAESYYQLGLARQFNGALVDAKEAYQRSINIVQLRVDKLKGQLAGLEGTEGEEATAERTRLNEEIGELEALTPEMSSKLEECNEPCAETLERIKEAKECFVAASEAAKPAATTVATAGDVKDITSLVKSKRKIESGAEEGACNGTKKTKMSEDEGEEAVVAVEEKMVEAEVVATAAVPEKIEVDENKENVAEAESKMEEGKVEVVAAAPVTEEAVAAETAPVVETTTTAEPIASA